MSFDARLRLQAAMSLLDECRRQLSLIATGDATVQGIAYGEASLALAKAHAQVEMVLRKDEEEAA